MERDQVLKESNLQHLGKIVPVWRQHASRKVSGIKWRKERKTHRRRRKGKEDERRRVSSPKEASTPLCLGREPHRELGKKCGMRPCGKNERRRTVSQKEGEQYW